MKIIVIGTRGIPNLLGGVETHNEELLPRIAADGYDVTVIRRKGYVNDNLKVYNKVKLIDISSSQEKSLEAILHTLKAVRKAKFLQADVLHIHAVGPALVTPIARMLGLKVVFTNHGPDYRREKWGKMAKYMLRAGERMGAMFANEIIVISEVINTILKEKYHRTDAHLIYNGVPTPNRVETTNYLNVLGVVPQKYIFAMGRFVPEKNFHQLIKAFSSLNNNDGYQLVLAGDNDFEDEYSLQLKNMAREHGVVLTGFIKGDKLHELLTHAAVFVLPSSHEGLPIALLEAMSYDLPVIVSDIPANLVIGLSQDDYFPVGDEEKLKDKLKKLDRTSVV
jgi:glycosyltransferase involved in cell wall biosynthesis